MSKSPRRALILIDVQNEYVTGNLLIEYPDVRLSLRNIAKAAAAADAAGIPIVVVQNTAPPTAPVFVKGTPGWELHPVVTELSASHYVEKALPSAFTGTDLAAWLKANDIAVLTVAGYMTHNCVDSTIKQARDTSGKYFNETRTMVPDGGATREVISVTILDRVNLTTTFWNSDTKEAVVVHREGAAPSAPR